jgi:hypothetical protein
MITGRGAADPPVRLPCPDAQICVHMMTRAHILKHADPFCQRAPIKRFLPLIRIFAIMTPCTGETVEMHRKRRIGENTDQRRQ